MGLQKLVYLEQTKFENNWLVLQNGCKQTWKVFFFCGLFYDARSMAEYIVSNVRTVCE
jgi:hypothetical protein